MGQKFKPDIPAVSLTSHGFNIRQVQKWDNTRDDHTIMCLAVQFSTLPEEVVMSLPPEEFNHILNNYLQGYYQTK
jgi:hypothetical protein